MKIKQNLPGQFRKPSGNLGRLVGWVLAFKNRERSRWTLEKLKFKPTDNLLEIGYGPGVTMKMVAGRLTGGSIAGIDHSEVMLEQARYRNKNFISRNKVNLECGTVSDLNYSQNYFDIIFGSNVHFFWDDPAEEFQQLYHFLKPKGRLVMVFQPRWASSENEVKEIAKTTRMQYEKAGYRNIDVDFKAMKSVTCIAVSGEK